MYWKHDDISLKLKYMKLKALFTSLLFMLISQAVFAQIQENPSVDEHYELSCQALPSAGCNLILNPDFYSNTPLKAAFSLGNVPLWQDVNGLTSDINGVLGAEIGLYTPSPPSVLPTVNYASMMVDNLYNSTEGISAKINPLSQYKKYGLSFFLSSSSLDYYRSKGGFFKFKIFLTNCRSFTTENVGNPEIGEGQLIFCKQFEELGTTEDWQQYFITFEAAEAFDMIVIYPEVEDLSEDAGSYVHFAYPELIPINPTATYRDGLEQTSCTTTLTACGVTNAQYEWSNGNGFITASLSYVIEHPGNENAADEYTFKMWVTSALGNEIEECGDAESPTIEEPAEKVTAVLSVVCATPVIDPAGCNNFILNPQFTTASTSDLTNAFQQGIVIDWQGFLNDPDINAAYPFTAPATPQPPTLPTEIAGGNYASMSAFSISNGSGNFLEGMSTKIQTLTANHDYLFSVFVSSKEGQLPAANVKLRAKLAYCQNYLIPNGSINGNQQEIFCELIGPVVDGPWQQYVVKFTANEAFDMLILVPDVVPITTAPIPTWPTHSWLHVAYPEIFEAVAPVITVTSAPVSCDFTLTANTCSVKNTEFTWYQSSTVIGNTAQVVVGGSTTATYVVEANVSNAVVNNNCSDNDIAATQSQNIISSSSLHIQNAEVSYFKAPITFISSSWVTEPIYECTDNLLCYGVEEFTQFSGQSNLSNNNIWEARFVPGFGNLDANFSATFNSTAVTDPLAGTYYPISTSNSFSLDLGTPGGAGYTFMIEIRLKNTGTGQVKNMFVKNIYAGGINQASYWCVPASVSFNYPHEVIFGTNHPGFTYSWVFPSGMTILTPLTNCQIEFMPYSGSDPDPIATLTVTNSYGCPSPSTINIHIASANCSHSRPGKSISHNIDPHAINHGQIKTKDGRAEIITKDGIRIYPNPSTSYVNIESSKKIKNISIYSSDGKLQKNVPGSKWKNSISVNELKAGIYFFKIIFDDGAQTMKHLIKN